GPRQDDANGNAAPEDQQAQLGFVDADGQAAAAATPVDGNAAPAENESGEGREKRSRDRYGRERGPRQDRGERGERQQAPAEQAELAPVEAANAEAAPQAVATPVAAPVAVSKAAATAPAPAATGMPKVTTYALPLQSLQEVAQGSGLQWVNSDPERVATVQAAIAAEPVAVHVPRERPAPVALDDRPLVLVETKRDLRNMTLPFEQEPAA
ncbi:MAG TPA: ribonuclease E/G, partial [Rhodoferax sp.]|nr:ribonuclease E/G [Rhodoferax sp.]